MVEAIGRFRDPTAEKAIRRVDRGLERKYEPLPKPKEVGLITLIQEELTTLNRKRSEGLLTRGEFNEQRRPLKMVYKALIRGR